MIMAKMMAKDLVSVALIVALVVVCELSVGHGHVANSESEADIAARLKEFLDAHNEARAQVGVGPLRWSAQLAHEASLVGCYRTGECPYFRRRPNKAIDNYESNIARLDLKGKKYGVNELLEYRETMSPRMVVEKWVEEKKYYNHSANSCAPNHHCDSYTQVVWRKSLELGCAMDNCGDGNVMAIFSLCYYNPPGNYNGQSPY